MEFTLSLPLETLSAGSDVYVCVCVCVCVCDVYVWVGM